VDELRQVDTAMEVSMNGFFMSGPVDVMHDSVRPFVSLLDILLERRSMGSISDEGFIVVGDSRISNLKLSTGVGKEEYMWAMAPMVELEFACCGIGIDVELGEERKAFVGRIAVLVSLDVLDSGA
jgi:hypothetical protein